MYEQIRDIIKIFPQVLDHLELVNIEDLKSIIQSMTLLICDNETKTIQAEDKLNTIECLAKIISSRVLSIEENWQLYWFIYGHCFNDSELKEVEKYVYYAYHALFEQYLKIYEDLEIDDVIQLPNCSQNPIIIVTSQFLGQENSVTKIVRDYAYEFAKKNIPVMIINDSGMNMIRFPYIIESFKYYHCEKFNNTQSLNINGLQIPFYQVTEKMPVPSIYKKINNAIYALNPRLILNITGSSLLADSYCEQDKVLSMTCSFKWPISRANNLLLFRDVLDSDDYYLKGMKKEQRVIKSRFLYKKIDDVDYKTSREEFGYSDDDFILIIAGNRLDSEISETFYEMLNDACDLYENMCFLVFGKVSDNNLLRQLPNDRIIFAGEVNKLYNYMSLGDAYIKPISDGSGLTTLYSMLAGKPVVTINSGDSFYVFGDYFSIENYDEMISILGRLYLDEAFYKDASDYALSRGQYLVDTDSIIDNILMDMNIPL